MADVASLAVGLHLNAASFKSQLLGAYGDAENQSRRFNRNAQADAKKTEDAYKKVGLSISGMASRLAAAIWQREQEALANLPAGLSELPTDTLLLQPVNMVGVSALKGLLDTRSEALPLPVTNILYTPENLSLSGLVDDIARSEHGLIMLMGKGGVGKTTMAAAIAVRLADMGFDVHLTTSDPAAHLSTTLNGSLKNLQVSRINPHDETERYRQHVLETKGRDLDEAGKRLLEEDLRSPCTEEIAVFQAFSRVIREAGKRFVVMDTAPTGHTLLLLDATGAYHREIAKKWGVKVILLPQ
ncbi:arsenical pump-driving ATPase [Klebsiella aerogenes]|nr:arsenical pump-driving ATPase [Klebsiella aerogenes]